MLSHFDLENGKETSYNQGFRLSFPGTIKFYKNQCVRIVTVSLFFATPIILKNVKFHRLVERFDSNLRNLGQTESFRSHSVSHSRISDVSAHYSYNFKGEAVII